MRRLVLCVGVVAIAMLQSGCDLAELAGLTPTQLETKAQKSIRPYFPHAVVKMDLATEQLLVVTCADNIGEQLLHEIAPKVMEMPDIRTLRSVRRSTWGAAATQLAGVRLPRLLSLAFDKSMLVLDTQTDQYAVSSDLPPAYFSAYREGCSEDSKSAPAPAQATVSSGFVWLGAFRITYLDRDGKRQVTIGSDALGIYPSDVEFAKQQQAEVAAREHLISQQFRANGNEVIAIELERVEKVSVALPNMAQ